MVPQNSVDNYGVNDVHCAGQQCDGQLINGPSLS